MVVHWHEVDGSTIPAGIEVRRYDVAEDSPAGDGSPSDATPEVTHFEGFSYDDDRPPAALTSTLLANSIGWGDVLGAQRARLVASFEEYADDNPNDSDERDWARITGEKAERGMVWMPGTDELVRAGTGTRTDPANDATFRLVANLLTEVGAKHPLRVLRRLRDDHDFPLDAGIEAHCTKVRGWCKKARDLYPSEFASEGRSQRPHLT